MRELQSEISIRYFGHLSSFIVLQSNECPHLLSQMLVIRKKPKKYFLGSCRLNPTNSLVGYSRTAYQQFTDEKTVIIFKY